MEASGFVGRLLSGNADGTNFPQMSTSTASSHSVVAVGGTLGLTAAAAGWISS
jgi:hypothetical protein